MFDNNLGGELEENRSFLNQSQWRKCNFCDYNHYKNTNVDNDYKNKINNSHNDDYDNKDNHLQREVFSL